MNRNSLPTVCLVDDDPQVLKAQGRLLREYGFRTALFASAEEFLAQHDPAARGCLVLDVGLPGLDGLALQRHLAEAGTQMPVVFVTGNGDIPMSVRAIKAGAVDFLTKPVSASTLLAAVRVALEQEADAWRANAEVAAIRRRYAGLSSREREVLAGLAAGKLNKQIAGELGIAEATVKFHRARLMDHMRAKTVAELMHLAARLKENPGPALESAADETPVPSPRHE